MGDADREISKVADAAVEHGLQGWWARADENQKAAVVVLSAAAALGPLGQGAAAALGVLFGDARVPTSEQISAVGWMFLIAAPIALAAFAGAVAYGRVAPQYLLVGCAAAALFGVQVVGSSDIPAHLGNFYCYAAASSEGTITYERECRAFDQQGFTRDVVRTPGGVPQRSFAILALAFAYTADARGNVMAVCALLGALAFGYLVRRELSSG